MQTIQLAITQPDYRGTLEQLLRVNGGWSFQAVETPDMTTGGVVVVDDAVLDRLPQPLAHPERVVLITHRDPSKLARAWDCGIRSVVYYSDQANTAVLAILAATLRIPRPRLAAGSQGGPADTDPRRGGAGSFWPRETARSPFAILPHGRDRTCPFVRRRREGIL
jgi:hypothetical protein